MKTKTNNGITLIALVITIIVLLILAGVTIAMLTGDSGILTRANDAKIETRAGMVEEIVDLWKLENKTKDHVGGIVKREEELLQEMLENKSVYENEINREQKTITIGKRIISYALEGETSNMPLTDIYVALYTDGTLVFQDNFNFEQTNLSKIYRDEQEKPLNIKESHYKIEVTESGDIDLSKLPKWIMDKEKISKVEIKFKIVPKETALWFFGCNNVKEIKNVNNIDTSNVTDMEAMFMNCSSLATLDVSNFDTSDVRTMNGMFSNCSNLVTLDVSNFDTSDVRTMNGMFSNCSNLVTLDVSNFNTSNVTNMGAMFMNCSSLATLDVSNFDTSKVTTTGAMFMSCSSLATLDVSSFNTSNVTNMEMMFEGCFNILNLDVSKFNTNNVKSMLSMFNECKSLKTLDVSNFNTTNVTDMRMMFAGCRNLKSLDLSSFNTNKVTDMINMFSTCQNLEIIYASEKWNVSNADTSNMFLGCKTDHITLIK